MTEVGRRVRITGRVQGVSYRAWTQELANGLGLTGWVRNEDDGSVMAEIHGPSEPVGRMIDRLWHGPALAKVASLDVQDVEVRDYDGFSIAR